MKALCNSRQRGSQRGGHIWNVSTFVDLARLGSLELFKAGLAEHYRHWNIEVRRYGLFEALAPLALAVDDEGHVVVRNTKCRCRVGHGHLAQRHGGLQRCTSF